MPRRPQRNVPTVIVPGWQGSGPGHWQSWLADELSAAGREVRTPTFASLDEPELADWLAALRRCLDGLPEAGYDLVAHSLGSVLWLHHVATSGAASVATTTTGAAGSPRPARAALVAPPSPGTTIPETAGFFPPPLDVDALRRAAEGTVLVAGDDDPYLPEGVAEAYGRPLMIATTVLPGAGHINPDAGYGEWPSMRDWCGRDNLAFY